MATPIPNGRSYFAPTAYTGNGTTQSITNNIYSDFVWVKCRTQGHNNVLQDSVRGFGTTKNLVSNATIPEGADVDGVVTGASSTGFSVGPGGSSGSGTNLSGQSYASWAWKANSGANVTNTNGSITSTVSVNTTSGFSVVTYTGNGSSGATVGHGLGVAPSFIMAKRRNAAVDWEGWHVGLSANNLIRLNTTGAQISIPGTISGGISSSPTSTTFSFVSGSSNVDNVNANGGDFVAYCWAPVAGYSAMGSYTGNGSSTGPFVNTGFRPAYVMIKCTTRVEEWHVHDTGRNTFNTVTADLWPNSAGTEVTSNPMNILSNGFNLTSSDSGTNNNGDTYIYVAFAANPMKYANAF